MKRSADLNGLPPEMALEVLVHLPYKDMVSLCQSNKRLRELCAQNELHLFRHVLSRDFGVSKSKANKMSPATLRRTIHNFGTLVHRHGFDPIQLSMATAEDAEGILRGIERASRSLAPAKASRLIRSLVDNDSWYHFHPDARFRSFPTPKFDWYLERIEHARSSNEREQFLNNYIEWGENARKWEGNGGKIPKTPQEIRNSAQVQAFAANINPIFHPIAPLVAEAYITGKDIPHVSRRDLEDLASGLQIKRLEATERIFDRMME